MRRDTIVARFVCSDIARHHLLHCSNLALILLGPLSVDTVLKFTLILTVFVACSALWLVQYDFAVSAIWLVHYSSYIFYLATT